MKKNICVLLVLLLVISLFGCGNDLCEIPDWTFISQETRQLMDGVAYRKLLYNDPEGLPHILYVLTVDPAKAYLYTGTVDNDFNLMPQRGQTVADQMRDAADDGIAAVAGVNGDFFSIRSTYMPSGLCIKEGRVIRENSSHRPYSAFTTDGKYIICDGKLDKVALNSLQLAVGGSHVIVKNGKAYEVDHNSDFGATSHPRTLSGVKEDGTILFVVIDGRQPELSNGAPLYKCAQIMIALGAVDAINHDGGGSSTMVLHSGDTYETVNSPSDGNMRAVYNSILVVPKDTK
jgi:hypothetical protein